MTIVQITQDDIDYQNQNYDHDYLSGVKVGNWVYDDGEILCSQGCINHWYQTSVIEKQREKYQKIFECLKRLNSP